MSTDAVGNVLHVPGYSGPGTATTDVEILAAYHPLTQKGVTFAQFTEDVGITPPEVTAEVLEGGTLDLNATYRYVVTSLDADDRETLPSDEVSVTTEEEDLLAPTTFAVTAKSVAEGGTGTHAPGAYFFVITALSNDGETTRSLQVDATVASEQLTAPGNVSATPGTAANGQLVDDTYYYKVTAVNANGETTGSTEVNAVVSTSVLAPVAATGTAVAGGSLAEDDWFYVVTAVDGAANETDISNEKTATTSGANLSVTVTWAASTGAVSYNVYRSTSTGTGYKLLDNTAALTYTDDGTVNISATDPPGSNQTGSTGKVDLTWDAVTGATEYNIYRSDTTETYGATSFLSNEATTSYTDLGVVNLSSGTVPGSNTTEVAVEFDLSWDERTGATGYKIYRSATTNVYTDCLIETIGSGSTVTFIDATETTGAGTPPSVSTAGPAPVGSQTAGLTWDQVVDATGYNIYRSGPADPDPYVFLDTTVSAGYQDDGSVEVDVLKTPPLLDETAVRAVWAAGLVVCETGDDDDRYRGMGLIDDQVVKGINRNEVDVSEEDKVGNIILGGRVKASLVHYVDTPAPLSATQLRTLAGQLGGRYEVIHDMIIF